MTFRLHENNESAKKTGFSCFHILYFRIKNETKSGQNHKIAIHCKFIKYIKLQYLTCVAIVK